MPSPVILSAVRTAVATSFRGSLVNTTAEDLAAAVIRESVERSGVDPSDVGEVILAESSYGGGNLARYGAIAAGMSSVPGQAVNRHCAGGLAAVANASAHLMAGFEKAIVAGGVQAVSTAPAMNWRVPGGTLEFQTARIPPTHPESADAPSRDMSITAGWNTARKFGISRERMDEWALRSHQRAIAAIDKGSFANEIMPIEIRRANGTATPFMVDEHPQRAITATKLAALPVLHPEIPDFSITAGNSSGVTDAAAALVLMSDEMARWEGLPPLATVRGWAAHAVEPRDTGLAAVHVIPKVLKRSGLSMSDVALWEINETYASIPIAACMELGIDESLVNTSGSGCSLGHPIAATGARMLTTLVHSLLRKGGGIGIAATCADGGQAGAVVVEV